MDSDNHIVQLALQRSYSTYNDNYNNIAERCRLRVCIENKAIAFL